MKNDSEMYELEDRDCPICGNFIKIGSPIHRCLDKDLKKLYKEEEEEETEFDKDRSYDDKLNEFDEFYNSEKYYDDDNEE